MFVSYSKCVLQTSLVELSASQNVLKSELSKAVSAGIGRWQISPSPCIFPSITVLLSFHLTMRSCIICTTCSNHCERRNSRDRPQFHLLDKLGLLIINTSIADIHRIFVVNVNYTCTLWWGLHVEWQYFWSYHLSRSSNWDQIRFQPRQETLA
jgi:hypothetical protein